MFKFIKKNVQIYKKKYGKKIKEPKNKIVINLDYYEPGNPHHNNIIENYSKMKKMERFRNVCNC